MNIGENIQRIMGGKSDIKQLARKKNIGEIPSSLRIDEYADYLGQKWPNFTYGVTYDGTKIRGKTDKWNQLAPVSITASYTHSGVVFTNNRDGSYTLKGISTESAAITIVGTGNFIDIGQNRKFLAFGINLGNAAIQAKNEFDQDYFDYYEGMGAVLFSTPTSSKLRFNIRTFKNAEYDNTLRIIFIDLTDIFRAGNEPTIVDDERIQKLIAYAKDHPQFDAGSLTYAYYKGIKLGEYDYIDTTNNELVLNGAEVDISQMSLTRFLFGSNYLFYGANNDQEANTTNIISANYQTAASISDIPDMSVTGYGGTGKNLWFRDDSCTTVEQFKTKNAEKKVYYKLATPIEIDLS